MNTREERKEAFDAIKHALNILEARTEVVFDDEARQAVERAKRSLTSIKNELDGYDAWANSVNEALNSGSGVYRP